MNWVKRGKADNLLDVILENSGMTEEELLKPKYVNPESIEGLQSAANAILLARTNKSPVTILGDYDVDGITATNILYRLFCFLGLRTSYRLPKRFSEGYGISIAAIDEITDENAVIVTVDNGISAIEAIAYAKSKGFTVIVIDHHLPGEKLPDADVIVDPHIHPENNGYENYCGAGLAFKLAEIMLNDLLKDSSITPKVEQEVNGEL